MQRGNDLFIPEIPNPDEGSSSVISDLGTNSAQSPVGIKITKTLEGLTSVLRYKEESPSPNTTDQTFTQQSAPNHNTQETEIQIQDELSQANRSENPDVNTLKSSVRNERDASDLEDTSLYKDNYDGHQLNYHSLDSAIDLSRQPDKMSKTRNYGARINHKEAEYSEERRVHQYSLSSSSHFITEAVCHPEPEEHINDYSTFDDDDDDDNDDLKSSLSSDKNNSNSSSEANLEWLLQNSDGGSENSLNTASNRVPYGAKPDSPQDQNPHTADSRKTRNNKIKAVVNRANRTPSKIDCMSEESLHLKGRRLPNSKSRHRHTMTTQTHHQDSTVKGSTHCKNSTGRLENSDSAGSLVEDLELSRILPLN